MQTPQFDDFDEPENDWPERVAPTKLTPGRPTASGRERTLPHASLACGANFHGQRMTELYEADCAMISRMRGGGHNIGQGFVPGMLQAVRFYSDPVLSVSLFDELRLYDESGRRGDLPALKQLANAATLPGVCSTVFGMPDCHAGNGFPVGAVVATRWDDPASVVAISGIGVDINCGVRLIRTNLDASDLQRHRDRILRYISARSPTSVPPGSVRCLPARDVDEALMSGMGWAVRTGHAWEEDRDNCEMGGKVPEARADVVSADAKMRGVEQAGTLGSGNHYIEIQAVDQILDEASARAMGITRVGQVVVMIHTGSRGLGYQVGTEYCNEALSQRGFLAPCPNDPSLVSAPIQSDVGSRYLAGMNAAANYALVNRALLTESIRSAFADSLGRTAHDMDMAVVYDTSHNIARREMHEFGNSEVEMLVHRKGATRAMGPGNVGLPVQYRAHGQPVLVGGSMGTNSWVLTGTADSEAVSLGSTCHGSGRRLRRKDTEGLNSQDVLNSLVDSDIVPEIADRELVKQEAPVAYKDVQRVVDVCQWAGLSRKCLKLRPIGVFKG